MVIFLRYLGIAALIPFIAGLLGFSRRASYLVTAALACDFIYLGVVTFSDELKYQNVYPAGVGRSWHDSAFGSGIAHRLHSGPLAGRPLSGRTSLDKKSIAVNVSRATCAAALGISANQPCPVCQKY
jgi:hypothetical protein